MTHNRTATAYLQIRRGDLHNTSPWSGHREATVQRVTNTLPEKILPGCVVVKVRLNIPDAGWEPISPEAVIDVPAELVQRPVQVEAVQP